MKFQVPCHPEAEKIEVEKCYAPKIEYLSSSSINASFLQLEDDENSFYNSNFEEIQEINELEDLGEDAHSVKPYFSLAMALNLNGNIKVIVD